MADAPQKQDGMPPRPNSGEPDFGDEGAVRQEGARAEEGAINRAPTGVFFSGAPELGRGGVPLASELLRVWLSLGLQTFGGGMATLALLRRTAVDERRWLTEAEFARDWALVQLAPGINLLALTILIGRRTAGTKGIVLALFGLLLPSVTVTILLTAFYRRVQEMPPVREALHGIIPAVVGLGLVTAWQIARPPLMQSRREGWGSLSLSVGLLLVSGFAAWQWHPPVLVILGGAGLVKAVWRWARHQEQGAAR